MTIASPLIPLQPGENYRFKFDATKCIGCKCCEVACHEQNNNPPDVKWRQVGEIEGGEFPDTKRFYISMSCNHCLDPACLKGCPVDAYYKDETTGVVRMKDNACIGCQYCTWNCPYGAPQFNPERGMVTKCDMCHGRIDEGLQPACVSACPSGALEIERFSVEEWKKDFSSANAPGVPDAAITQSTTNIIPPKKNGFDLKRIDAYRIQPEHAHYSLILLTVLTQLAVGGFGCLLLLEWLDEAKNLPDFFGRFLKIGHLAMLALVMLALNTSFFHLGRPLHAIRALKMWKRSWLSREVLFFSLFTGSAVAYSAMAWQPFITIPFLWRGIFGLGVALFGLVGVYCSAMIYRVPARPSWDTVRTPIAFMATAFVLGPLVTLAVFIWSLHAESTTLSEVMPTLQVVGLLLGGILLAAGFTQIGGIVVKLFNTLSKDEPELKASALMLTGRFRTLFLGRLGVLLAALFVVPMTLFNLALIQGADFFKMALWLTAIAVFTLASELTGRYLFFVTVVPKKRPEGYF